MILFRRPGHTTGKKDNFFADAIPRLVENGLLFENYIHDDRWHHFQHINKYHFEHVFNYEKWNKK